MKEYRSIEWQDGVVQILDQRLIPQQIVYRRYDTYQGVIAAIRDMEIRGAPAIGAAAGYGLALVAYHSLAGNVTVLKAEIERAAKEIRQARPTAVNLFWALERVKHAADGKATLGEMRQAVIEEAKRLDCEDAAGNRQIGLNALPLVPDPAIFIHHCNTGALATCGYGTALGVIRAAYENGRKVFVYVDETRPRLQGARLTSWELQQQGIDHAVIADGASGYIMRTAGVNIATVGGDRVAANGDTANKIGTYNLAIVAKAHNVPFYVVVPTSTIDLSLSSGDAIPIEERPECEVTHVNTEQITPHGVKVRNPAFDVTPATYITAIITEVGVAYPPYTESLRQMVEKGKTRK